MSRVVNCNAGNGIVIKKEETYIKKTKAKNKTNRNSLSQFMRKSRFIFLLVFLSFFIKNETFTSATIPISLPSVSVGSDGKASFGIPIELPPGTQDMVPSLGISYYSASGNGLIGVGWSLSGLHTIIRDPSFGVKYDGTDRFLSSIGGAMIHSSDGNYYHKKENYYRIQSVNTCGSGPCYFVATDPNGTRYTFGNTTDSRIEAVSSSIAPANSVRVWALNEVRDSFGNSYSIQYTEDVVTGNYYPSQIQYNNRTIGFTYETKPEATPSYTYGSLVNENKRITNISIKVDGGEIRSYGFSYNNSSNTKRSILESISRSGMNSLTFSYSKPPVLASNIEQKALGGLQLINQVRNPVKDTSPPGSTAPWWEHHGACLVMARQCTIRDLPVCNPTVPVVPCLSAGEKSAAAQGCNTYTLMASDPCLNGKNIEQTKWWLVDIDGDGAMDFANLFGTQDSGAFQLEVTRNLATTPKKGSSLNKFNMHVNTFTGVADMNGDRKTDFVYSKARIESVIVGYEQKCHTEPEPTSNDPDATREVCVDDVTKPIYNLKETGQVITALLSDGNSFDVEMDTGIAVNTGRPDYWFQAAATLPKIFLGDINGDTLTDVLEETGGKLRIALAYKDTDGKIKYNKSEVAIPELGGNFKQLTDMDGDGKAEYISVRDNNFYLVSFSTTDLANVSVTIDYLRAYAVNMDSVYDPKKTNMNDVVNYPYDGLHWLADVNGDGKQDYVYQSKEEPRKVCVNLFDGKSFGQPKCSSEMAGIPYRDFSKSSTLADVNGDGMADFLYFDGSKINIALSNGTTFELTGDSVPSAEFYTAADLNGDGKSDFLSVKIELGKWSGSVHSFLNPPSASGVDLLTKVSNGPQSVDVSYQTKASMTDAVPTGGSFPILPDASPEYLATKVTFNANGGLSAKIQTYEFKGKRTYSGTPDVRADLGFETMKVIDGATGFYTVTTYDQSDYKLAGMAKSSVSYNAIGQKTNESSLTNYSVYATPWGTYTPRVYESTSKEYKGGALLVTKNSSAVYDAYGNVTNSANTVGSQTITTENLYAVDATNWSLNRMTSSKTSSDGVLISEQAIVYSGNNVQSMQKKVTGSLWATTSFGTYDSFGNPTQMTDAKGNSTTILYDTVIHKFPIEVTNAKGHKVKSTYDFNNGNVLTKTDQNNAITVNEYDTLGRLAQVTYPGSSGWNEKYEYNNIGNPASQNIARKVREVNSNVTLQTADFIDGLGRTYKKESTGIGGTYSITELFYYNDNGTLWKKSLPYVASLEDAKYIEHSYDSDLSVNAVSYPDGRVVSTSNSGLTITNVETAAGATLRTTVEVKNELGQTLSRTFQGLTTSYTYDKAGRVTAINSPEGGLTTFTYDFSGRKISQTDKNSGTSTYTYDVAGSLISQTDAKGNTITMEYDVLGRPTRKVKPEGEVTYAYDENSYLGKLTKVVDDSGITSLNYDSVGRLIERKTKTDGPEVIFRYGYDTLNRMNRMIFPDGTVLNSVFAPSGHLNQITMDSRDGSITGSPVVTYELDLTSGQHLLRRITGNEVKTEIGFDPITNRPLSYLTKTKSNLIAENVSLSYDKKGNITRIEDLKSGSLTMNYSYDSLDRLVSSTQGLTSPVAYQYSPSGNLLKKGNIDYTYNSGSQPNAVKTAAVNNGNFTNTYFYTYDAKGNMVRRNGADATSGDRMTYDSENRLTKIEDDSGNELAKYFYDQGGQRSKKVIKDGSVVYEFGGIYEIAIPNGKPQQQTIYVRGLQGEVVAQMTDPGATLITSADIENNERYALNVNAAHNVSSSEIENYKNGKPFSQVVLDTSINSVRRLARTDIRSVIERVEMTTNSINLTSAIKHFVNRHVVLNSKLLFQDHSSFAYILGGNRFSDKTRVTVVLLFLMFLFYLAVRTRGWPLSTSTTLGMNSVEMPTSKIDRSIVTSTSSASDFIAQESTRYNPFITFSTPLILTMFLMTFSLGGCMGLTKHSSQTPWGAIGIGLAATTPTLGTGGSTPGFGAPGQGGGSTGSGSSSEGTPVAGMYFFHNDQIGSTKLMTNSAGEMVAGSNGATNIVYNPYGDIDVDHSHGPDILRNKFTGQQLDNESGLYYYNARYYDPALGRFISADPLLDGSGSPSGMDPYMYVSGNPVKFNDPSGHKQKGYGAKMIADFKSAAFNHINTYGTPETKLAFMAYGKEIRRQKANEAHRAQIKKAIIQIAVIVAVVVISYFTFGAGAGASTAAAAPAMATTEVTVSEIAFNIAKSFADGIMIDAVGQGGGRLIGAYTSNSSHSWNTEGANRGQRMGADAAFAFSLGKSVYDLWTDIGGFQKSMNTLTSEVDSALKVDWSWESQARLSAKYNPLKDNLLNRFVLFNTNTAIRDSMLIYPTNAVEGPLFGSFKSQNERRREQCKYDTCTP